MERARFEYKVTTVLRLTREEVRELIRLCETHYDLAVRQLTAIGGPLTLAHKRLEWGETLDERNQVEMWLSHRELDTLCKGTEAVRSGWVSRQGHAALYEKLLQFVKDSNAESIRLHRKEDKGEVL